MSSQRHRQVVMNYGAACTAIAEKQPAAGYLRQIPGPYTVPVGAVKGPLQGSSLAGPPPAAIPGPQIEHELLALGLLLAAGQKPLEPPEPVAQPVIDMLDPSVAEIGSPDITMRVLGTGFTEDMVISFNGGDEATTFVSENEVTTGVKPSTAGTAGSYPVHVHDSALASNQVEFTFTEPTPEAAPPATRSRRKAT